MKRTFLVFFCIFACVVFDGNHLLFLRLKLKLERKHIKTMPYTQFKPLSNLMYIRWLKYLICVNSVNIVNDDLTDVYFHQHV